MPDTVRLDRFKHKCAEIFYSNESSFAVACVNCELITKNFGEFCSHFLELHTRKSSQKDQVSIEENKMGIEIVETEIGESDKVYFENQALEEFRSLDSSVVEQNFVPTWHVVQEEPEIASEGYVTEVKVEWNVEPVAEEAVVDADLRAPSNKVVAKKSSRKEKRVEVCMNWSELPEDYFKEKKTYQCQHCDKSFVIKINRDIHQFRHTGDRKFQCADCYKCFYSQLELRNHMRYHSDEQRFVCEHCGKGFRHSWVLKKHSRTHINKSPTLPCPTCGKLFAYEDNLRCHRLTHSTEAKFSCDLCDRNFTQHKLLWTHKRRHHRTVEKK